MQNRDKVHVITLPRVKSSPLCPLKTLQEAVSEYAPMVSEPLFQNYTKLGWVVVTESRIRKFLAKIIKKLGYPQGHFTFHSFQRPGASLVYNAHVPIQSIKHHGSWASDCVWTFLQQDESFSANIASSFATLLHNVPT